MCIPNLTVSVCVCGGGGLYANNSVLHMQISSDTLCLLTRGGGGGLALLER